MSEDNYRLSAGVSKVIISGMGKIAEIMAMSYRRTGRWEGI